MVTFVVHWQTFTAGRELTVSTIHVTDLLRMLRTRSRLLFKVFTFFSHSLDKIRHKEVTFKLFQPTCRYRWSVFAQRTCNLFRWIRCPTFKAGETETMSTRQDTWINEDFQTDRTSQLVVLYAHYTRHLSTLSETNNMWLNSNQAQSGLFLIAVHRGAEFLL